MHALHHCTPRPSAASRSALVLAVLPGILLAVVAEAQRVTQATSVAVVPFADRSKTRKELVSEKATDAVALALDESHQYVVTPKADTRRELEVIQTGVGDKSQVVLSKEQMVRLGERLRVDKVASGSVDALVINPKDGTCRCVLTVRLLDIVTQEYLDGATADYTTKPIPGWKTEEAEVINEALRSAAEEAVRTIITTHKPRGNVDMVDRTGSILVNLGSRDGVEIGMELLVVRGIWNAAEERVIMRKIGVIEVKSVELTMCRCAVKSGATPRTADKCYVLYRPQTAVVAAARKARMKSLLTTLAAALLGVGIYNTAIGPDNQSPPGVRAFLTQAAPGSEPRIRVDPITGSRPDPADVKAWLVYRGERAGFPAEVDNRNYLVAAVRGSKLQNYEDDPTRVVDITFNLEFQYFNEEGDQEDATLDITYNHLELVPGRQYYYKLRRIVDPGRVRIPIATQQQQQQLADVEFDLDPSDAISEESPPAGPVTFFYPPEPQTPSDGNLAVDPGADRTVFTWQPSFGADEYQVMIFTDPNAAGTPVKLSPVLTYTGTSATMTWRMNTALQPSTTYYWFVGARRRGEAEPLLYSANRRGWILSRPFMFKTAPQPPTQPSSVRAGGGAGKPRPVGRTGWWQETRAPRR